MWFGTRTVTEIKCQRLDRNQRQPRRGAARERGRSRGLALGMEYDLQWKTRETRERATLGALPYQEPPTGTLDAVGYKTSVGDGRGRKQLTRALSASSIPLWRSRSSHHLFSSKHARSPAASGSTAAAFEGVAASSLGPTFRLPKAPRKPGHTLTACATEDVSRVSSAAVPHSKELKRTQSGLLPMRTHTCSTHLSDSIARGRRGKSSNGRPGASLVNGRTGSSFLRPADARAARQMRLSTSLGTLTSVSPYAVYNPSLERPSTVLPPAMNAARGGSSLKHFDGGRFGGRIGLGRRGAPLEAQLGQLGSGWQAHDLLSSTEAALLESELAQGLQTLADAERSAAIEETVESKGLLRPMPTVVLHWCRLQGSNSALVTLMHGRTTSPASQC